MLYYLLKQELTNCRHRRKQISCPLTESAWLMGSLPGRYPSPCRRDMLWCGQSPSTCCLPRALRTHPHYPCGSFLRADHRRSRGEQNAQNPGREILAGASTFLTLCLGRWKSCLTQKSGWCPAVFECSRTKAYHVKIKSQCSRLHLYCRLEGWMQEVLLLQFPLVQNRTNHIKSP